jgi:hypothetical protein
MVHLSVKPESDLKRPCDLTSPRFEMDHENDLLGSEANQELALFHEGYQLITPAT